MAEATSCWSALEPAPEGDYLLLADPIHLMYLANFHVDPFSLGAGFRGYLLVREDGHAKLLHDDRMPKSAAQAQGMQDVFMNILTTNGLVGRYVTDWAGPDAVVRNVAIKLGAPNLPGDTMKMSGKVTAADAASGVVEVAVVGANGWGDHVTGTVKVALPKGK